MNTEKFDVVVIGAGLGGLSAAEEIHNVGGIAYMQALDVTDPQAVAALEKSITAELGAPVVFAPLIMWVILTLSYLFPQITHWLLFNTGSKRKSSK